mmetsp:Transcript_9714/g.14797  ORF Transcript_9714/g.14797 Transcript_9714/m.14797 type:complete len:90 (-) Transcript_9714:2689-2958(-)
MHIIEESKAEQKEMPQDWVFCSSCAFRSKESPQISKSGGKFSCCLRCGTLIDEALSRGLKPLGSIKEPRFMKNTNHLDPLNLYQQMVKD